MNCSIDGCERPLSAKGLCKIHYDRKRNTERVERGYFRERYWAEHKKALSRAARWRARNPARVRWNAIRTHARKFLHAPIAGSFADFEKWFDAQDLTRCQNEGCPWGGHIVTSSEAHVDHDHVTGRLRGILCRRCNQTVEYFAAGGKPEALLRYLAC